MGTERLGCGTASERRRGASRAVACLVVLCAAALAGCGSSAGGAGEESEKAADAELANSLLSGELTLLRAYGPSLGAVRGADRALLLRLHGQDQAHVDGLTKVLHGLGAETDAEAEELEEEPPKGRREAIVLVYEAENAALAEALAAAPKLETYAPRDLATGLAASHAQHLVLLRKALGAPPAALAPAAFESGEEPPPGEGR
jgi:predicted small secreted protein